jgi:HEAT repeat protein
MQIVEATLSTNDVLRTGAVQVLRGFRGDVRPALPRYFAACTNENPRLRGFSAAALGASIAWNTNVVRALIVLLEDPEEATRIEAIRALARSSVRSQPALPRLTAMLRDPSPAVREAAAWTLGQLSRFTSNAIPELEQLLNDSSATVRTAAGTSIAAIRAANPGSNDRPPGPR